MSCDTRLDIRGKCFTIKDQGGCLLIRSNPAEMGHEHILCVQGDERILIDAFDEYVATDVFEHYVRCRDINYLRDTSHSFTTSDVIGLEFNFIHTDPGESSDLTFTSGDKTATITTSVQGTTTEPIFTFGDDLNSIQFTEPETKKVRIGDLWYIVTFVSFTTAVFTIDRIAKILFPDGTIAAIDDLIGEIVVIDDTIKPIPSLLTKIDELLGEIVFTDTEPEFVYKSMLDELVSEIVFKDMSLDFLPPTDLFVCDIPDLPPPSPTPTPTMTPTMTPTCTPPFWWDVYQECVDPSNLPDDDPDYLGQSGWDLYEECPPPDLTLGDPIFDLYRECP